MGFQVSPGVMTQEIDLTNVVPASATSVGAVAGAFAKGPMNQVTTIESEKQLIEIFGNPNIDIKKNKDNIEELNYNLQILQISKQDILKAVSYTHLTLPTNREV